MSKWNDNYSELFSMSLPTDGNKEWHFKLEEHKNKGTMQINIREFKFDNREGGYNGPTRNGFIFKITSEEDLNNLEKTFNDYIKRIKDFI